MEKLPIKFFSVRNEDNQRVEGAGSIKEPNWALRGDALIFHSKKLSEELLKGTKCFLTKALN